MAKLQLPDTAKTEHHQRQLKAAHFILPSHRHIPRSSARGSVIAEVGAQTQALQSSILHCVKQFKASSLGWGQQWK